MNAARIMTLLSEVVLTQNLKGRPDPETERLTRPRICEVDLTQDMKGCPNPSGHLHQTPFTKWDFSSFKVVVHKAAD